MEMRMPEYISNGLWSLTISLDVETTPVIIKTNMAVRKTA
jgi:hypothetical protein